MNSAVPGIRRSDAVREEIGLARPTREPRNLRPNGAARRRADPCVLPSRRLTSVAGGTDCAVTRLEDAHRRRAKANRSPPCPFLGCPVALIIVNRQVGRSAEPSVLELTS